MGLTDVQRLWLSEMLKQDRRQSDSYSKLNSTSMKVFGRKAKAPRR
jgi:hypothetical protein